jgi:hypothetical protein
MLSGWPGVILLNSQIILEKRPRLYSRSDSAVRGSQEGNRLERRKEVLLASKSSLNEVGLDGLNAELASGDGAIGSLGGHKANEGGGSDEELGERHCKWDGGKVEGGREGVWRCTATVHSLLCLPPSPLVASSAHTRMHPLDASRRQQHGRLGIIK